MRKFKDYFQDKIDKEPPWADVLRKIRTRKAELEGDPEEESGNKDHETTEKLSDGADYPL
tara:strand:+ start:400 stop:579 length:180 start_codon:yes stop_codon:yes gene_type:complete